MAENDGQNTEARATVARASALFFVVAWRSIAVLTVLSVLAGIAAAVFAWPLLDATSRTYVIREPAPVIADAQLAQGREELAQLEKRIAELNRQIAAKQATCRRAETTPPALTLTCQETCRLCKAKKTELTGNISISLSWDGREDLDLYLVCPNGTRVKYNVKTSCGAILNHDMNVVQRGQNPTIANLSDQPVENITIGAGAPPGRYRIEVEHYSPNGFNPVVNFRVNFSRNGKSEPVITGVARNPEHKGDGKRIVVKEFDIQQPDAGANGQSPRPEATTKLECEKCNCGVTSRG